MIVMIAPPNPYRCPPGPMSASMMAHVLKAKGYRRARIVILDPETFSKQALFQEGWEKHYPAWWNGRTRRCTAASTRSIPRP